MTATELQRIASRLANQSWCRYWLNYGDRRDNILMAIQCIESGKSVKVYDLPKKGFTCLPGNVYTIPRTNEDGSPFVAELF